MFFIFNWGLFVFITNIADDIEIESETNLVNSNDHLHHGKRKTRNRKYVVRNKSNVLMTQKAHSEIKLKYDRGTKGSRETERIIILITILYL